MKKITIVLLFLCFSSYSQFSVGIKAGAMLSNLKFENTELEKGGIKPSFYAGGFFEYKFNRIAGELDVTYNEGGSRGKIYLRQNFDDNPREYSSDYKVNSVLVSVAAKLYLTKKFALKFGGYYGSILSVNNETNYNNANNFDYSDNWEKIDSGIILGLNYNISKHLFLDGTYLIGITDLRGVQKNEVYSRNIKIGAGYRF